jgi:mRNA-degrading endonuclease toxin of MazEF toxin-antitoxin module
MNRGDVLLARFPHSSGGRGKKRPVVVLQADRYNQALRTVVVAEVTKNLVMANDPACLLMDAK